MGVLLISVLVLFCRSIANGCVKAVVGFNLKSLILACISDVHANTIENGKWTLNNRSLPGQTDADWRYYLSNYRYKYFADSSVQINPLRYNDSGLYQCCSQDGQTCSCVINVTVQSSLSFEAQLDRVLPASAPAYQSDKIYWMPDAYSQESEFFYNDSTVKLYCHFTVRLYLSYDVSINWYLSPPLSWASIPLVNHDDFLVETAKYNCTDPMLRDADASCFKTWLTFLKPPDNGQYKCTVELRPLSVIDYLSFRPLYLIPGQETPLTVDHIIEKEIQPTGIPDDDGMVADYMREFGYMTSEEPQSDFTEAPSMGSSSGGYTEVSEGGDDVTSLPGSTALPLQSTGSWKPDLLPSSAVIAAEQPASLSSSGGDITEASEGGNDVMSSPGPTALKLQSTESWKTDLLPSSTNTAAEPTLVITVSYWQRADGICLASVSCLCSETSFPKRFYMYATDTDHEDQPSAGSSPMDLERILPMAESWDSSNVSARLVLRDELYVHCFSDCGVTFKRITPEGCNSTGRPKTLSPSLRSTHKTSKTAPRLVEVIFLVVMILSAWGAIFAGLYACICALRIRRLPKEAFVYSHDTAPEAGKQQGEDKEGGAADQVSDDPQSLSTITEPSYLNLYSPSSSTITTDSYPILMRQAPNSPTAGAGGGDDDGGYGRLLLTQLNHLFSTGPYSLLETGCQSPVSDQPGGDATAVAATTATEDDLVRDTDGNGEGVTGSRADGPDTRAFEAAYGTLVAIENYEFVTFPHGEVSTFLPAATNKRNMQL